MNSTATSFLCGHLCKNASFSLRHPIFEFEQSNLEGAGKGGGVLGGVVRAPKGDGKNGKGKHGKASSPPQGQGKGWDPTGPPGSSAAVAGVSGESASGSIYGAPGDPPSGSLPELPRGPPPSGPTGEPPPPEQGFSFSASENAVNSGELQKPEMDLPRSQNLNTSASPSNKG